MNTYSSVQMLYYNGWYEGCQYRFFYSRIYNQQRHIGADEIFVANIMFIQIVS